MRTLLFLLITLGSPAAASSCMYRQPFLEAAQKAKLVVQARVIKYLDMPGNPGRPLAMVVKIEKTFRGSTPLKTLTVYGDNGGIPRPFVTQFPVGSTWLFPLVQDWIGSETVGRKQTDYALPVCSDGGLVVLGNQLFGLVDSIFNSTYPVKKIPELLKRKAFPYRYYIEVRKKNP